MTENSAVTDTDALVATVREALGTSQAYKPESKQAKGHVALDALAVELERVKAERDEWKVDGANWCDRYVATKARLDKALVALQEIERETRSVGSTKVNSIARAALAEIEGGA